MHVAHVSEVGVKLCGRPAKEQIRSPGRAANQNFAAIDFEKAIAFVGEFGGDFANAKGDAGGIRYLLADFEAKMRGLEIWRAHLIGPPKFGTRKFELLELLRREFDNFGFAGGELHWLPESDGVQLCVEHAFDCFFESVPDFRADG